MRLIKRLAQLPLRARCAKGFGVHSPFAYRFITTVFYSPDIWCWYSYSLFPKRQRRLYRVLVDLAPQTVVKSGPLSQHEHAAIDAAVHDCAPKANTCKVVIITPGSIVGFTYINKVLAEAGAAIFTDLNDRRSKELFEEVAPAATAFEGLRFAVVTGAIGGHGQRYLIL